MKDNIFGKGLIIGVICILILPSITVATAENNSDYNLTVKVKNTKFIHREGSFCQLFVNVSNEGQNISDNYSVNIKIYTLFTRFQQRLFTLFHEHSYTGSPIAPNSYNTTRYTFIIWVTGWYLVHATVNSNDNNLKGNVSYCFI